MLFFKINTILYMKHINTIVFQDINKLNSFLLQGFIVTTHTSFSKNKFVSDSLSQSINNYYVQLQSTNQFSTILTPTDHMNTYYNLVHTARHAKGYFLLCK